MVDNRTMAILMELFATRKESLYELSIQTGIEKEQLHSNLELVNQLLQEHSFPQIQYKDSEFVISTELYNQKESVFSLFRNRQIYLSQEERQLLIYLYTFIRKEFVSNVHYQELLSVSRNTTLTDIKNVKELCLDFQVRLEYTRAKGYHLIGREEDKHRLALYALSNCLQSSIGVWALDYILKS
ncbi:TPA: helix-turn-helix domain-containing protein, partial [Streptococcus suis]